MTHYKKDDVLAELTPAMMAAEIEAAEQNPAMMETGTVMLRSEDGTEQDHYRLQGSKWVYRKTIRVRG
jgi:hypothetical protein